MRSLKAVPFVVFLLVSRTAFPADLELSSVLEDLDAYLEWNPLREIGVILIGNDRVAFKLGIPIALVNYEEKVNIDPPVRKDGAIYLTEASITAIREALIRSRFSRKEEGFRVSTILIDPGHGGEDPGSVDEISIGDKKEQIREKDVVLTIFHDLSGMLAKAFPDKKILSTRSSDEYVSLEKRADMANALLEKTTDSILYISIHTNRTAFNNKASGFEVWYLPPEYKRTLLDEKNAGKEYLDILPILNSMLEEEISVESIVLAQEILAGINAKVGSLTVNRGLKEESWYVVRNTKMPAVLIEVGFLSNPEEAKRLADDAYLKDLAEGIYNGIRSFIARFEHSGSLRVR
jgi:N-acetylmuramoyl-L-alanine amidase